MNTTRSLDRAPSRSTTPHPAREAEAGVTPHPVLFDGAMVGMALSLDRRFKFFTTDTRLMALDGAIFDSVTAIRESVRRKMIEAQTTRTHGAAPSSDTAMN